MTAPRSLLYRILDNPYPRWILVLPSVILFALFALPLAALIARSFSSDFLSSALSVQAFQALSLSLVTSSITTVIAVALGTPLAYMLARSHSPQRAWLELILDLPIVLPPSVAGLALLIAFGRHGLFGPALSGFGVRLPFTNAAD